MKHLLALLFAFAAIEVSLANATRRPLPPCATVKCAEACLDNPTRCTSKCNHTRPCPKNLSCIDGLCDCPRDTYYRNGRCRPIVSFEPSCAAVQCLEGSVCKDGKCSIPTTTAYDQCIHIKCSAGFYCYQSQCVPNPPTTTASSAHDKCYGVTCAPDYICINGKCSAIFTRPTFTSEV